MSLRNEAEVQHVCRNAAIIFLALLQILFIAELNIRYKNLLSFRFGL